MTAAEATTFVEEAVTALRDAINARLGHADETLKEIRTSTRSAASEGDFKKLVAELDAKHGPKAKQTDGSP